MINIPLPGSFDGGPRTVRQAECDRIEAERAEQLAHFDSVCSRITGRLYLASASVAASRETLARIGVTLIINCAADTVPNYFERTSLVLGAPPPRYLSLAMRDSPAQRLTPALRKARCAIDHALTHGGRVLVHCSQGVSRSAAVVVGYLMSFYHLTYAQALAHVRDARGIASPNPGFALQLERDWEPELRRARTTLVAAAAAGDFRARQLLARPTPQPRAGTPTSDDFPRNTVLIAPSSRSTSGRSPASALPASPPSMMSIGGGSGAPALTTPTAAVAVASSSSSASSSPQLSRMAATPSHISPKPFQSLVGVARAEPSSANSESESFEHWCGGSGVARTGTALRAHRLSAPSSPVRSFMSSESDHCPPECPETITEYAQYSPDVTTEIMTASAGRPPHVTTSPAAYESPKTSNTACACLCGGVLHTPVACVHPAARAVAAAAGASPNAAPALVAADAASCRAALYLLLPFAPTQALDLALTTSTLAPGPSARLDSRAAYLLHDPAACLPDPAITLWVGPNVPPEHAASVPAAVAAAREYLTRYFASASTGLVEVSSQETFAEALRTAGLDSEVGVDDIVTEAVGWLSLPQVDAGAAGSGLTILSDSDESSSPPVARSPLAVLEQLAPPSWVWLRDYDADELLPGSAVILAPPGEPAVMWIGSDVAPDVPSAELAEQLLAPIRHTLPHAVTVVPTSSVAPSGAGLFVLRGPPPAWLETMLDGAF